MGRRRLRDEPDELAGASHFLEHLLFKGTDDRSARSIADCRRRGGRRDERLHIAREHGVLHAAACRPAGLRPRPAHRRDRRARLPACRGRGRTRGHPRRDPHERGRARRCRHDSAVRLPVPRARRGARDARLTHIGRGHASRRRSWSSISSSTGPRTSSLSAAGDLHHEAVVESVGSFFAETEAGAPSEPHAADRSTRSRGASIDRPTEQAHVAMGWRGLHFDDPDRYALWVANHVAGGGMSSRLFQEVREERGLAYTVYTSPSSYQDCGSLSLYAGTSPVTPGRADRRRQRV